MIGIIIPPGQIKKLVQKTAEHVAINGSEFQKMILQREQHKKQFSFLNHDNPYRSYYDHMVAQISKKMIQEEQQRRAAEEGVKEGYEQEALSSIQQPVSMAKQEMQVRELEQIMGGTKLQNDATGVVALINNKNQEATVSEQANFLQKVFQEVKQPDPQRFIAEAPEKITQAEHTIIQHTAQYVAKNGKNFLSALSERQKNNPQFQFLKSSSANHEFFVKMYQAYQAILNLTQSDLQLLQERQTNPQTAIFQKCEAVFRYYEATKATNEGNKGKKGAQKEQKQEIDWNDYELVETIVFDDMTGMKSSAQQKMMNKLSAKDKSAMPNPYAHRTLDEKVLNQPKKKEILQQCHVCRQNILASEMTKHLKTCLGDKKRGAAQSSSLEAQGRSNDQEVDIRANLKELSKKRGDIFGGDGSNITRQQQDGTEKSLQNNEKKVIWDGQSANITRTTGGVAMVNNQQRKLNQQQMQQAQQGGSKK